MVATIPTNPFVQIGGNNGLFNVTSVGARQGTAEPDPSTRFRLRGGVLAQTETIPMWGGVGIYADVPAQNLVGGQPSYTFGPSVGRAVSLNDANKPLLGFSVFDEAYNGVTSPQSPVPLIGSGGQVNWYPLGSLARIAVACDPALVDLRGANIGAQVSWDFTNQLLIPYTGTLTITSGTYNSTTGEVTLTLAAGIGVNPGDLVAVSGATGLFLSPNVVSDVNASGAATIKLAIRFTEASGLSGLDGVGAVLG
jgi:hypothetical protein